MVGWTVSARKAGTQKEKNNPETNGNVDTNRNLGLTNSDASRVLVLSDFERFLTFLSFYHNHVGSVTIFFQEIGAGQYSPFIQNTAIIIRIFHLLTCYFNIPDCLIA